MTDSTSTLDRVLRLQGRARFIGAALIPIIVGLSLTALWPGGGLLWWAVFAAICMGVHRIYSLVTMGIIGGILINEMNVSDEDDEDEAIDEIELTIKDHGPVIGTFKDHEIHEWIEFADEQNCNKAHFAGTIEDPSRTTNLPEYSIVMPGGIIYQFDMSRLTENK